MACRLLSGCDALTHQALAPKRVHVDVSVEPMFAFMHKLGVQSHRGGHRRADMSKVAFGGPGQAYDPIVERHPHLRSVIDFYCDRGDEDERLAASALGQLELVRTMELIERDLPAPPAAAMDVGGGTGRYAAWLAGLGYTVHLVEPVPLHLRAAEARAAAGPAFTVSLGHAGELPAGDSTQDVVLLLGPLYHLPDAAERAQAWSETRRVLRPDGVVVAVSINQFAGLLDGLRHEFVDTGFGRVGYFHPSGQLADEARAAGLRVDGVFGVDGPGCLVTDLDERWLDARQRKTILDAAREVEAEPSLTGASHHTLVVARRSSDAL